MLNAIKLKMKWFNGRALVARKNAVLAHYEKLGYKITKARYVNNQIHRIGNEKRTEWSHEVFFGQTVYEINGLVTESQFKELCRRCTFAPIGIFSNARFSAGRINSKTETTNGVSTLRVNPNL